MEDVVTAWMLLVVLIWLIDGILLLSISLVLLIRDVSCLTILVVLPQLVLLHVLVDHLILSLHNIQALERDLTINISIVE